MNLRIFDCSNYIYAGCYAERLVSRGVREVEGEWQAFQAPIGGVRFLIRQIANFVDDNTVIIPVFDRTPTIKRDMFSMVFGAGVSYKGTRPPTPTQITLNKRYAEQCLINCGFDVKAVDEYEADDVIYSLVEYYKDSFDHIYIHTKDSDLTFLVSDKVSIEKVGEQGKHITMSNYEEVAVKGGCYYNTISIIKLCSGDTSDCIKGIGWEWADVLSDIVPQDEFDRLGEPNYVRKYLMKCLEVKPNLPNGERVLQTYNLMCPLLIPDRLMDLNAEAKVDRGKLEYFLADWNPRLDRWDLEEKLMNYISDYYE